MCIQTMKQLSKKLFSLFLCCTLLVGWVNAAFARPDETALTVRSLDVTISDVVRVARYLTGQTALTLQEFAEYDLTGDGQVNVVDLTLLARKLTAENEGTDTLTSAQRSRFLNEVGTPLLFGLAEAELPLNTSMSPIDQESDFWIFFLYRLPVEALLGRVDSDKIQTHVSFYGREYDYVPPYWQGYTQTDLLHAQYIAPQSTVRSYLTEVSEQTG